MKLLLTSDWQADITNLVECQKALEEVISLARKHKVDAIIHGGDLKERYDNVSLRVVKFWARAVRRIRAYHIRLLINLGNHDRLSQSASSKNWLDILTAAGAETVSKPVIKEVGDGVAAFLPFTADKHQEKEWADALGEKIPVAGVYREKAPTALIFHCEIADMELTPNAATKGITRKELHTERYDVCVGGHIHLHQHTGNVWYIGSPFCIDWAEVNQQHGYLLVEVNWRGEPDVRRIVSKIPNWYDADWLEKHPKVKVQDGALIRSTVLVNAKKITQQLKDEETRLKGLYGSKVRLFVRPRISRSTETDVILTGKTDEEKIGQYVQATLPENVRFSPKRAIKYLNQCLEQCGYGSVGQKLTFLSAEAHNWLSFKEVKIKFTKQGLVLLRGVNRDLVNRSNGAGKTTLLSLLPSIMFGETLKGQKNDELAHEHNDELSWGKLRLKNARGQTVEIYRQRRPHAITLTVDGKDVSSGITGKGKNETQGLIEKYTGYDLHLLKNSVYIDQNVVNSFVFGTQKDRMDLINKIENLERFDAALQVVKADEKRVAARSLELQRSIQTDEETRDRAECELSDLKKFTFDPMLKTRLQALKHDLQMSIHELNSVTRAGGKLEKPDESGLCDLVAKEAECEGKVQYRVKMVERLEYLLRSGKCSMCGQPIGRQKFTELKEQKIALRQEQFRLKKASRFVRLEKKRLNRLDRKWEENLTRQRTLSNKVSSLRDRVKLMRETYVHQRNQQQLIDQKKESYRAELKRCRLSIKENTALLVKTEISIELYQYAMKAFNRGGIPLYLSSSLCPLLNQSAEQYSEMFSDGQIKCLFDVVDGQFTVDVINTTGSQTTKGQSVGESSIVGLITAFSLREAAPKTNLLVLDEPGSGLDPESAKKFAQGLLAMKNRWSTVIVTTHNPVIQEVLAGERHWKVIKQKRVSRLVV